MYYDVTDGKARPMDGGCRLVGFGNPDRRDDGLGPIVVAETLRRLKNGHCVEGIVYNQPVPELAETLAGAEAIVMVDAAAANLGADSLCRLVVPRITCDSWATHSMSPEFLIALTGIVGCPPSVAWLITIQGEDFGYGRGLSYSAAERAEKVIAELVEYVSKEGYNGRQA